MGLVDDIFRGHRLGITKIRGLTLAQTQIEFIGYLLRAFVGANAAGNTLLHVDVARHFPQSDGEIARLAADADHLCRSVNFYVNVPADLDQLGRDNSHGTVIGGKGLV